MDRTSLKHLALAATALGLGSASSLAQTIHHSIQAPTPATNFGGSVTRLGDWDGGGHDDFAVGDWKDATQGEDAGTVIVYSGWGGAVLRQYYGLLKDRPGYWIDDVGDVNADGYADLVIGTLPWGVGSDGVRCVAPVRRVHPAHVADASGTLVRDLDFDQTPFNAGPGEIEAGSTWNFQFWFRDPGWPGFNASRGVQIQLCP